MANGQIQLGIVISAFADGAKRVLGDLQGQHSALGKGMGQVNLAAAAAGGAIVGAYSAALVEGGRLESGLAKVNTLMGEESPEASDRMRRGLLDMAGELGSVHDLTEATYQAISAGAKPGADALALVEQAAKLAAGGFTETLTAVDLLTTVQNAYGESAGSVTDIADRLIATQNKGKTTVDELASSLGDVIPIAAQLGIPLEELLGSVAALTTRGIATSKAVTGLRAALTNVLKPGGDAAKMAEQLEIDFSAARIESEGWIPLLAEMAQKAEGNTEAISALFGSVEGLNAVLALTGMPAEELNAIIGQITDSSGASEEAFRKMADTAKHQLGAAWHEVQAVLAEVGMEAMPALTAAAKDVSTWVSDNRDQLVSMSKSVLEMVVPALQKGVELGIRFLNWAAENTGVVKGLAAAFATLWVTGNILQWAAAISQAAAALTGASGFVAAAKAAVLVLAGPAGLIALFTAATFAAYRYAAARKEAIEGYRAEAKAFVEATRPWKEIVGELHAEFGTKGVEAMDAYLRSLGLTKEQLGLVSQALGDYRNDNKNAREFTDQLSLSLQQLGYDMRQVASDTDGAGTATGGLDERQRRAAEAGRLLGIAQKTLSEHLRDELSALRPAIEAWTATEQVWRNVLETSGRLQKAGPINLVNDNERLILEGMRREFDLVDNQITMVLPPHVAELGDGIVLIGDQVHDFGTETVSTFDRIREAVVTFANAALDVLGNLFGVQIPQWARAATNAVTSFLDTLSNPTKWQDWVSIGLSAISAIGGALAGLFSKTTAEDIVAGFGVSIDDALTDEIQRIGDQHGRDYGAAFRLSLAKVIAQDAPQTAQEFNQYLQHALNILADYDRGTISSQEATDALASSMAALLPYFDEFGVDLSVLTGPGGHLSDLVNRFKNGEISAEQLRAVFAAVAEQAKALGMDLSGLAALAAEAGLEIEGLIYTTEDLEHSAQAAHDAYKGWQDAEQRVADLKARIEELSAANRKAADNAAYVEDAFSQLAGGSAESIRSIREKWDAMVAAGAISAETAERLKRAEIAETERTVKDSIREQLRAAGLHGEELERETNQAYSAWREHVRETEREEKRAARDAAREQRKALREELKEARETAREKKRLFYEIRDAAVAAFSAISDSWLEAMQEMIDAGEDFWDAMVGHSVFPDVEKGATKSIKSIGKSMDDVTGDGIDAFERWQSRASRSIEAAMRAASGLRLPDGIAESFRGPASSSALLSAAAVAGVGPRTVSISLGDFRIDRADFTDEQGAEDVYRRLMRRIADELQGRGINFVAGY